MYGIIYCIKNVINNHKYIGQTIRTLEGRMSEHYRAGNYIYNENRALYQAFKKYGKENFISYKIDYANNQNELDKKETYWIKYYNTFLGKGYNMTAGGQVEKKNYKNKEISNKLSEIRGGKEFLIFDNEGNYIKTMVSQTLYAKELNCNVTSVNNCLKGIKTQVKNHVLIFKNEYTYEKLQKIIKRINRWHRYFNVYDGKTLKYIGTWKDKKKCSQDLKISLRGIQKQLKKGNTRKSKYKNKKYIFKYIDNNLNNERKKVCV